MGVCFSADYHAQCRCQRHARRHVGRLKKRVGAAAQWSIPRATDPPVDLALDAVHVLEPRALVAARCARLGFTIRLVDLPDTLVEPPGRWHDGVHIWMFRDPAQDRPRFWRVCIECNCIARTARANFDRYRFANRTLDRIQELTDKHVERIDSLLAAKEQEVMTV